MNRYDSYISEVLRLGVLVVFLVFSGYFLRMLPFISDLFFIKPELSLSEFIEFLVFIFISFLLFEFAYRVEDTVSSMIDLIPGSGRIHRYVFFIISFILIYWGGVNVFSKLIGNIYLWMYQIVFAGILMFIVAKIFLIIYYEGDTIGRNIFERIKKI